MPAKNFIEADTRKYIAIILEILRRGGPQYLRGLSNIMMQTLDKPVNPNTVKRILEKYMKGYVVDEKIVIYGNKSRVFRLKEGKEDATAEEIIRAFRVRQDLEVNT